MARRKRQLNLLGPNQEQPETAALFDSREFPYDTPDEIAYNARRKKDGLFEITPAEEAARKQALSDGSVQEE
jgi:hypothetical protein